MHEQDSLLRKLLMNYSDKESDVDGVKGGRIAERLAELAKIGMTEEGGSRRLGFSKEERQAKELVKDWMRQAGLVVREDGAGNVFGRMKGKEDDRPAILSGSHVDTVPNGGHFDGALGVVAALEVVEAWNKTNYRPEYPFEVVIFSDEEGSRFNDGYIGSKAMMGKSKIEELMKQKDGNDLTFEEVLNSDGLSIEGFRRAKRNREEIELYVEVHIEQGKKLEKANLPCGIVSGIAGPSWFEITFYGDPGHAGSTPMDIRSDALVAAGKFIHELSHLPKQVSDSSVATVGKMFVEPNGVNVIPGKVTLYADIRDIHEDTREILINRMQKLIIGIEKEYSVRVHTKELMRIPPVLIKTELQEELSEAFSDLNLDVLKVPSGAGHDAMIIGEDIPVAMLFVRSKDGISHSPMEWSSLNDCVLAVHVLKRFVERMNKVSNIKGSCID